MVGKVTPNSVLSASRLPAVMGLSKYRSPNDELQVSVDAINGKVPEDFTNEAMQWGNDLESMILRRAAERLGLTDLVDVHPEPYFHPKLPLCCSLDGTASGNGLEIVTDRDAGIFVMGEDSIILTGKGVIEAKLTSYAPEDSPPVWRGPIQLQAQMDIIGATWGVIATLYQGTTLRCFVFSRHQPTVDRIADVSLDFHRRLVAWEHEGRFEAYEPISSKDADRTWPRTHPDPEPVVLDDNAAAAAAMIESHKRQIAELQAEIESAEKDLKAALKDAEAGIAGKYQVRWPMRHYAAQPEKIVPAKNAYAVRQSTLNIKEIKNGNR
jgi:predicted phage-related endonuclease